MNTNTPPARKGKPPIVYSKLRLFIIFSIGLHLAIAIIYGIPEYMRRLEEKRQVELARQIAEQRREAEKRAAEAEQQRQIEATKEDVKKELQASFEQITADQNQLEKKKLDELWEDLMAEMNEELDQYARELMDNRATDADLRNLEAALKKAMVNELKRLLDTMTARDLAEAFLNALKKQVAPAIAEHYKKEIENKVGKPLQTEGANIVKDQTTSAEKDRKATTDSLDEARREADKAAKELKDAADRMAKTDPADPKAGQAATKEAATVAQAEKSLEKAGEAVKKASTSAERLNTDLSEKLAAQTQPSTEKARKETAEAAQNTKAGQPEAARKETREAADAAAKAAKAIAEARAEAETVPYDPAALARAVLKDVTDKDIKGMMEKAFRENFDAKTKDRLSDKLAKTFEKRLENQGVRDDRTVAEVRKKIQELLGVEVPEKTKANEAGTRALEESQGLKTAAKPKKGHADREKAVADKARNAARELAEKQMDAITSDSRSDETFAQASERAMPQSESSLNEKVANLVRNVNAGRMGLLESGGPEAMAQMRRAALERSQGRQNLFRTRGFNKGQYEELTAGMAERNRTVAAGEAWKREGAADPATRGEADESVVQSAFLLVPGEPKKTPATPEKTEPYKPEFKTINFTTIPFIGDVIKLDGELDEWKDIPAQRMVPHLEGPKRPDMVIVASQPLKLAWNNKGLYFACEFKDVDNDIRRVQPANFWEGDGLEVFIDALNLKDKGRRSSAIQQFWFWVDGQGGQPENVGGEAVMGQDGKRNGFLPYRSDKLQKAAKVKGDTWFMECHLPFARLHELDAQPGRIIGMNLCYNSGTYVYYYWGGTSGVRTSERPDTWGDALFAGADGMIEAIEKLTSELKVGETGTVARTLIIGAPLKLRVTDPDMNLADRRKDKVAVTVRSANGDSEVAILEETGDTTAVFEGALRTALSLGEPLSGTLSLYEGERVTATYTDQARADGSRNREVKATVTCAAGTGELSLAP